MYIIAKLNLSTRQNIASVNYSNVNFFFGALDKILLSLGFYFFLKRQLDNSTVYEISPKRKKSNSFFSLPPYAQNTNTIQ